MGYNGRICTLTTPRYTARADHLLSPTSRCACLRVSTTSPRGCWPTVCSWTLARPTCSGVQQLIVVISCPRQPVNPSKSVRDLGIYFDADLSMRCPVQKTVASCFAILRQLRSIRRSVPTSVYQALVVALVLSRLDYGNAVLVGLPGYLYSHLQSVLNAAARSIAGLRRSDHITDTLASFHWLRASERVQFKLATIVYRSLNGTAPSYLAADLRHLSDMPSRRRLRSSLTHQLDVPQSQCVTVGDRAFAVAGARLWNSLPPDIVASNTLSQFRRQLKTFLFRRSYPSVLFSWLALLPCGPSSFLLRPR